MTSTCISASATRILIHCNERLGTAVYDPDRWGDSVVRKIQRYGWKRDLPDARDLMLHLNVQNLPAKVDLRPNCPAVYDQGQIGSCTANAIAGALEKTAWNRKSAARLLKISYRTLLYKIEHYHMSAPMAHLNGVSGTSGREH